MMLGCAGTSLKALAIIALAVGAASCNKAGGSSAGAPSAQGAKYSLPAAPAADPKCQKAPAVTAASGTSTATATAAAAATGAPLDLAAGVATPAASPGATLQSASWGEVKVIIQASCIAACHTHDALLTFDNAKAVAAQMVEDTDLDAADPNFMPKGGQRLPLADRKKLVLWLAAGTPDDAGAAAAVAGSGTGTAAATSPGTTSGKSRFDFGGAAAGPPKDGCS